MSNSDRESKPGVPASRSVPDSDSEADNTASDAANRPKEIGGRDGLDPTRYGDWEKNGRCIDF
ncbi:MAG: DUF1674 domain-containing protein [Woeseiaceae bacterium]